MLLRSWLRQERESGHNAQGTQALKTLAATFLGLDAKGLEKASTAGEIAEVRNDDEDGKQD
jgi:hypothetical protein